jgi:hypothetical protein
MPPIEKLAQLNAKTSEKFLLKALENKPQLRPEYIEASPSTPNRATYLIDEQNKQIIFATPLNTVNVSDYLSALQEKLVGNCLDDYSVVLPIIGKGITEQHIVALYKPKGYSKKALVIDSKTSDPESFFKFSKQTFSQKFSGAFKGIFRALIPNYQKTLRPENVYFESVDYLSTGYQSYFDGVSCGYHTLSTILKLVSILERNSKNDAELETKTPQQEVLSPAKLGSLLNSVSNDPLIKENLSSALNEMIYSKKEGSAFPHYRHYAASAWEKALFNGVNEETRKNQKFQHIVFGWPLENRLSHKIIYFLSLTFVLHPLKLLLNLIVTLPINLLTEALQYWQDKVFLAEPKASITQYTRSAFLLIIYPLLGLSKALSFSATQLFSLLTPFEKILAPKKLTSYREGKKEEFLVNSEETDEDNEDCISIASTCSRVSFLAQADTFGFTQEHCKNDRLMDEPSKITLSDAKLLGKHGVFGNHSSEGSFSDLRGLEKTLLIEKTENRSYGVKS